MAPLPRRCRGAARVRVAILASCLAGPVGATECRVIDGGDPALGQVDASLRLAFIRAALADDYRHARFWTLGWGAVFGAAVVGELAVSPAFPEQERPSLYIAAGAAALGAVNVAVRRPPVLRDHRWLERRVASERAGADPCALLADAERLLVRDAAGEADLRGWLPRIGVTVINLTRLLVVGLVFHQWVQGALDFTVGITVGAIQMNTAPTEAVDALARYRAATITDAPRASLTPAWSLAPLVGRDLRGLALTLAY
jgi:hypothetical protein